MLDPEKERSGNSMKMFKEKKPKEQRMNQTKEMGVGVCGGGGEGMEKTRILKV